MVLLDMEGRGVLQDLIQDVGKLELVYVCIEGWITDPDVHSLLVGPHNTVCLLIHYGNIIHTDEMTQGVTIIINGGRALRHSLNLSPRVLADTPMYSSSQLAWAHLNL